MKYYLVILICFFTSMVVLFYCNDIDAAKKEYRAEFKSVSTKKSDQNKFLGEKWILEHRLDKYEDEVSTLNGILLNGVVLVALGLLLLIFSPKGLEIPFLSIKVPESLMYIAVIFGVLYIWQNLGLQLNSAIDSRMALHTGMDDLRPGLEKDSVKLALEPQQLLVDNGLTDAWTAHYFHVFTGNGENRTNSQYAFEALGLYGLFGTFFGLLYGICFTCIIEFGKRKTKLKYLANTILIFTLLLMVFANVAWINEHTYATGFTAFYWLVAGLFILIWKVKGKEISLKLSKSYNDSQSK